MENNPYQYDRYDQPVPWIPAQNPRPEGRDAAARTGRQQSSVLQHQQNQRPQQRSANEKPKPAKPMPKVRALALARTFKKWLVVASFVSFGTLSGLAAYHQVGTTTTAAQTSSKSSQTTATKSSSQKSNGFLKQQGGNNFGSSSSSQGSTSGTSSASSTPVSGSSVS